MYTAVRAPPGGGGGGGGVVHGLVCQAEEVEVGTQSL